MDTETAGAIGEVRGLVEGLGNEISGIRDQQAAMQGDIGSIKTMLEQMTGSGPQPVMREPTPATEPIHRNRTDRILALANTPGGMLVLCFLIGAILVGIGIAAYSGRSVSELIGVQGSETKPTTRSGVRLPLPSEEQ